MNNIGFKIKRLREQKNISQEELAYNLEISQSNLSRIENGEIEKTDFLFMQKVCEFFDVSPEYFLEGQVTQNNSENKNSAITVYGNPTVKNMSSGLLKDVLNNQKYITQLIETQNTLLENLLKKGS